MRIAVIGYGKMGKRIETLLQENGDEVVYRIDSSNSNEMSKMENVDLAFEFTHPEAAIGNYRILAGKGIPIVTGTTGWYSNFEQVSALISKSGIPFFYATNFSIGIHLTIAASNYLAKLISQQAGYKAQLEEWHHTAKKDAPSGTAITMAEGIISHSPNFQEYRLYPDESPTGVLPIRSYRMDDIPGTHQVSYSSEVDTISIRHTAHNRDGFVRGAILAGKFIKDKEPGMYTMKNLLNLSL